MRPKETSGQQQHSGASGQYQNGQNVYQGNGQNSYQGNGHGNHAGHPIYNGEKQSGHMNGNGGYGTYGNNSGYGNNGRYVNGNGQFQQPIHQNMPPPTNWNFQGPPVYGNGNRFVPQSGYGMNRGYQQPQVYSVPPQQHNISQNLIMMPPPGLILQHQEQTVVSPQESVPSQQIVYPQQHTSVTPQPMFIQTPIPVQAPTYAAPPNQFPHLVPLPPQNGFNGKPIPIQHHMGHQPVLQQVNFVSQPNGLLEYSAQQPMPLPPPVATNSSIKKVPKQPLFVNPAFVSANGEVQVFKNADGYTEVHASVPQNQSNIAPATNQSQPVPTEISEAPPSVESNTDSISANSISSASSPSHLTEKIEKLNMSAENSNSPSSLSNSTLEEVRTPTPSQTLEVSEHRDEPEIVPEPVRQEEITLFVEENAVTEQRSLDAYIFNALNFPLLAKRNLSTDAAEEYEKLIGTVQNQVKTFFRKYPDAWESANVSNRITAPANIQSYDELEDEQVENQNADNGQEAESREKMKVEFFAPKKTAVPPQSDVIEVDEQFAKLCFGSPYISAKFEKYIKDTPKTVTLEDDHFSINVDELEHEQMAALLRSGQRATIIMYTEFPNVVDDDEVSDSSTRPSSPEFPQGSNSNQPTSNSRSTQPSTSQSGSSQSSSNTVSSSSPSTSNGCSSQPQRSSRFSTFTTHGLPSNRGRSTSSITYPTNGPTLRTNPMRQDHPPLTRQPAPLFDDRLPGPSHRRLPEIPPEYRNGDSSYEQNGRINEHFPWSQIPGQAPPPINREQQQQQQQSQQQPRPRQIPVLRRRHQSHESTIRQMDGVYPRAWIHDHELLRFIIPTQREFMARVPFPPYRIPLIGVARRAPGIWPSSSGAAWILVSD